MAPLLKRKSVLMGMAASLGFGFAKATQPPAGAIETAARVAGWTPSTPYAVGQQVISPSMDLVAARVAHTSSATYKPDTVKWSLSPAYEAVLRTSDYGLHVSPLGSDRNDGLSPATAKLTLSKAIADIPAGSLVRLARGRHLITSLHPKAAVRIIGTGTVMALQPTFGSAEFSASNADQIGGTVLVFDGATGDAVKLAATSGMRNSSISDLTILGPGTGNSRGLVLGEILDGSQLIRVTVERVNVANFSTGVWAGCENSNLNALYIQGCLTGMYTENAFNGNTILGINVEACTNYGIRLTDSDTNAFTGGVIQGNLGTPLSLESSSHANTFTGYYFEQAAAKHSVDIGVVGASENNSFLGCHFETHAPAIRIAGSHNRMVGNESTPPIALTGNYCYLQGAFTGLVTDSGNGNVLIDSSAHSVTFGASDVQIGSERKFLFQSRGTNSYIMRTPSGSTELGLDNAPLAFALPVVQTTSPAAGAGAALPTAPAGYLKVNIAGVDRWMPYY